MEVSDIENIKRCLSYDKDTGIFTWIWHPIYKNKIGTPAGSLTAEGYVVIILNKKRYMAHRLAWFYIYQEWPKITDHINGVRDDNRITNLRNTDMRGNASNMERHRNGCLVGAQYFKRDNKWDASYWVNGKKYHIGRFDTEIEAHEAYLYATKHPDTVKGKKEERLKIGIPTGVYFCKKAEKWAVRVLVAGRRVRIGYYSDLEDAKIRLNTACAFLSKEGRLPTKEETAAFESGAEDIEEGA